MKRFLLLCIMGLFFFLSLNSYAEPQDTLIIADRQAPSGFDPAKQWDVYSTSVIGSVYNALCRFTPEGKLIPDLALSWKNIDDNTIQVKLRKGVKFHNGEPFNAKAVKFSIDRELDKETNCPRRHLIVSQVRAVEIVDDYTVNIITPGPRPMAMPWMSGSYVVPPVYAQKSNLNTHPVGTGPYKFVSANETNSEIILEANPDYFGIKPKAKKATYKVMADAGQRVSALLSGQAHIITTSIRPSLLSKIEKNKKTRILRQSGSFIQYIGINTEGNTPLSSKKVRQALNYAIDRRALIKHMVGGQGSGTGQAAGSGCFGYDPRIKPYPYDVDKAKQLLAEAGYDQGFEINFWAPNHYNGEERLPKAIKKYLEDIGIKVNLEYKRKPLASGEQTSGWKDLLNKLYSHQVPASTIWLIGWNFDIHDASNILDDGFLFDSKACYFPNREVNSLLIRAQGEMDPNKREDLLKQVNMLCHDEAAWIFLWEKIDTFGLRGNVVFEAFPNGSIFAQDVSFK